MDYPEFAAITEIEIAKLIMDANVKFIAFLFLGHGNKRALFEEIVPCLLDMKFCWIGGGTITIDRQRKERIFSEEKKLEPLVQRPVPIQHAQPARPLYSADFTPSCPQNQFIPTGFLAAPISCFTREVAKSIHLCTNEPTGEMSYSCDPLDELYPREEMDTGSVGTIEMGLLSLNASSDLGNSVLTQN